MGRIPDGLFSFIGEAAEAIESSDITTSRLQELIDLVHGLATDSSMTPERVADAIAENPRPGHAVEEVPSTAVRSRLLRDAGCADRVAGLATGDDGPGAACDGRHATETIINQVINLCVNNPPLPPIGQHP